MDNVNIRISVRADLKERLDSLARTTKRSRSELTADALRCEEAQCASCAPRAGDGLAPLAWNGDGAAQTQRSAPHIEMKVRELVWSTRTLAELDEIIAYIRSQDPATAQRTRRRAIHRGL